MCYKDKFYSKYYFTHVVSREGTASLTQLKQKARYFQRAWLRFLPADRQARIIDVGCGTGSVVWWLQRAGFANAEGIDVSAELTETAQALGVAQVTQADMITFLAARPGFYDVVIMKDVLEHFTKTEILDILEICRAALKNGGRLVIQGPNADTPAFGRVRYGDFTHEIAFSKSSLEQLLRVIGFMEARFYSTAPKVTGVRSLFRVLYWKPVEAFYRFLIYAETGRWNSIVTENIIAVAMKSGDSRSVV